MLEIRLWFQRTAEPLSQRGLNYRQYRVGRKHGGGAICGSGRPQLLVSGPSARPRTGPYLNNFEATRMMTGASVREGGQFFSRYPVLKIHHTATMQMARNAKVMPTLKPTLTSEIS